MERTTFCFFIYSMVIYCIKSCVPAFHCAIWSRRIGGGFNRSLCNVSSNKFVDVCQCLSCLCSRVDSEYRARISCPAASATLPCPAPPSSAGRRSRLPLPRWRSKQHRRQLLTRHQKRQQLWRSSQQPSSLPQLLLLLMPCNGKH